MKITIGNYPNRLTCRIHTRYMDKKYGCIDWPTEYNRTERFLELLEGGIQSAYNVINWVWFDRRKQKVKIRIEKHDTWSMDHTLAHIIAPMLKQLKEKKHGAPNVDPQDVPKELRPTAKWKKAYEGDGTTDPKFFERWDWVMDEMIWAFEQKCRDHWEADYYGPWISNGEEGYLSAGKFEWIDDEGRQAHQERMSNGFRLFGKYYEALWD